MSFIVLLLCLAGLWISIYFTGVSYHWFPPDVKWIPKVCQLKESSCMMIVDTPRAKIFGIPNSVFGIGLYSYLILSIFVYLPPVMAILLLAFAVVRSIYLAYSLIFVTKIPCPLCFTSHVINIILLLLVLKNYSS